MYTYKCTTYIYLFFGWENFIFDPGMVVGFFFIYGLGMRKIYFIYFILYFLCHIYFCGICILAEIED